MDIDKFMKNREPFDVPAVVFTPLGPLNHDMNRSSSLECKKWPLNLGSSRYTSPLGCFLHDNSNTASNETASRTNILLFHEG